MTAITAVPSHPADSRDAVQNCAEVPYKAPAELGMDLYSARVCRMARGRDGAPKKPETSSSVSEGRVWEVPSQKKKKRDLKVVYFSSIKTKYRPHQGV